MKKFRVYQSPFAYLSRKFTFLSKIENAYYKYNKIFDKDSKIVYSNKNDIKTKPIDSDNLFLGGFNPIISIGKDFVDTFKPYKSYYLILRDALQPFRGIGNVLKGGFNIIASPIIFVVNTLRYLPYENFWDNMALNLARSAGGLVDGISSLIRGTGQIGTTLLTFFFRMPLRGFITAIYGMPTLKEVLEEQAQDIVKLINMETKTVEQNVEIEYAVTNFYRKKIDATNKGQKLGFESKLLDDAFQDVPPFTIETAQTVSLPNERTRYVMKTYSYADEVNNPNYYKALNFFKLFISSKDCEQKITEKTLLLSEGENTECGFPGK